MLNEYYVYCVRCTLKTKNTQIEMITSTNRLRPILLTFLEKKTNIFEFMKQKLDLSKNTDR